MDQRDEFSKWVSAVEEALSTEGKAEIAEDIPAMEQGCGCGEWDCTTCFPEQNEGPGMNGALDGLGGHSPEVIVIGEPTSMSPEMGSMGTTCPACGQPHSDEQEVSFEDGSVGGMGAGCDAMSVDGLEEEPMDFEETPKSLPRGQNGGVKLGDIVQRFVPADQSGEESPLTHGSDNLGEEMYDDESAQDDFDRAMDFGTPSDSDIEAAEEMMSKIMYMQDMGLSKAERPYTEEEFQMMNPSELKQCYDTVMGTVSEGLPQDMDAGMQNMGTPAAGGTYPPGTAPTMPESVNQGRIMENVDKDVAAMLKSLKKYDTLKESVAPVLMARPVIVEGPEDKSDEADSEGGELDEDTHLAGGKKSKWSDDPKDHFKGAGEKFADKFKKEEKKDDKKVNETADPEVLEWMKRFAKLGR